MRLECYRQLLVRCRFVKEDAADMQSEQRMLSWYLRRHTHDYKWMWIIVINFHFFFKECPFWRWNIYEGGTRRYSTGNYLRIFHWKSEKWQSGVIVTPDKVTINLSGDTSSKSCIHVIHDVCLKESIMSTWNSIMVDPRGPQMASWRPNILFSVELDFSEMMLAIVKDF